MKNIRYLFSEICGTYLGIVRPDEKGDFPKNSTPIPPPFLMNQTDFLPKFDVSANVWRQETREKSNQMTAIEKAIAHDNAKIFQIMKEANRKQDLFVDHFSVIHERMEEQHLGLCERFDDVVEQSSRFQMETVYKIIACQNQIEMIHANILNDIVNRPSLWSRFLLRIKRFFTA